jgi:hypothetical protein
MAQRHAVVAENAFMLVFRPVLHRPIDDELRRRGTWIR